MSTNNTSGYIGRFAPSPTGRLHLGSLICALASFLDARANHGKWLLRIEDIDPLREELGASHSIIKSLTAHGMEPDSEILWQHDRIASYELIIDDLLKYKKAFRCTCTRKQIAAEGGCYPGYCRNMLHTDENEHSIRVLVEQDCTISFNDGIQGYQQQDLNKGVGDFIIKRKDGLIAYQLAVAIDDAAQGITHVVRGSDLMDSTCRQMHLQNLLELPTPAYFHIPVITHSDGHKLSKQTHAPHLNTKEATQNLRLALEFLAQRQPPKSCINVECLIQWAIEHWKLNRVPNILTSPATGLTGFAEYSFIE